MPVHARISRQPPVLGTGWSCSVSVGGGVAVIPST
jgi:hypothetical protein